MLGGNVKPYDHIVLGASLLSMSFAAVAAKQGQTVCILEKQARLGGAWALGDAIGFQNVETSPHIFLPDRSAYDFLDEHLDSQFQKLEIQPLLSFKPRGPFLEAQNCNISNIPRYMQLVALGEFQSTPPLRPFQFGRRLKRLRKAYKCKAELGLDFQPVMYPKGGLVGLYDRADHKLDSLGVDVFLNANVVKAEIAGNMCKAILQDGGIISGKKLWLTRHVELDNIQSANLAIQLKRKIRTSSHFVFQTQQVAPSGFRQFTAPSPVLFVNDVTDYIADRTQLPKTDRLFCARTVSGLAISADAVFAILQAETYFPKDARLVAHSKEIRKVTKAIPSTITNLKKMLSPCVDFLLADDLSLMKSIAALRKNSFMS